MGSIMHNFHDRERISGCVLVYRYTKERNINELRHNSMYGYENNRNSPVYRYTRTAPDFRHHMRKVIVFIQTEMACKFFFKFTLI